MPAFQQVSIDIPVNVDGHTAVGATARGSGGGGGGSGSRLHDVPACARACIQLLQTERTVSDFLHAVEIDLIRSPQTQFGRALQASASDACHTKRVLCFCFFFGSGGFGL